MADTRNLVAHLKRAEIEEIINNASTLGRVTVWDAQGFNSVFVSVAELQAELERRERDKAKEPWLQ